MKALLTVLAICILASCGNPETAGREKFEACIGMWAMLTVDQRAIYEPTAREESFFRYCCSASRYTESDVANGEATNACIFYYKNYQMARSGKMPLPANAVEEINQEQVVDGE